MERKAYQTATPVETTDELKWIYSVQRRFSLANQWQANKPEKIETVLSSVIEADAISNRSYIFISDDRFF